MKVTDLIVIIFVITLAGCQQIDTTDSDLAFQQKIDSIASKKIDSAYKKIARDCDTLSKNRLPIIIDSLLRADTTITKLNLRNR